MEIDESLKFWRLSEKLTILQAALLVVDLNPGKCLFDNEIKAEKSGIYEGGRQIPFDKTAHFRGAYNAIVQAGKEGQLKMKLSYGPFGDIDEDSSYVLVDDLKKWLSSRGLYPPFFSLRIILLGLRTKNMRFKIQRIHVMLQSLQLLLRHGKR
ncbi:hypothetical protein [Bartonella sp. CR127HXZ]|uniref:hypothetical protein n=1 Tax=Bartonella sp. CR127HXZ TaxID=1460985 RepID=UPI0035D03875